MPDKINPEKIDYDIDEGDYYRPDKKIKELHQELRDLMKRQELPAVSAAGMNCPKRCI